jgi:hypothetical protein
LNPVGLALARTLRASTLSVAQKAHRVVIAAAMCGAFVGMVEAAEPTAAPQPVAPLAGPERGAPWSSLTANQRIALAPLARDWPTIGADHKQKWLEVSAQFLTMSADERRRVQTRMADWAKLTPQQRGAARLQFKQARQLAPSNRTSQWEAYQALTEAEKKDLASRAAPAAARGEALRKSRAGDSAEKSPSGVQAKSNLVAQPDAERTVRAVAPTVLQAPTGATTTLISKPSAPPAHQQTGLPKIAASPDFVNPSTLLPQRGPQGAAALAGSAATPLARP